jgi:hypothetical protein
MKNVFNIFLKSIGGTVLALLLVGGAQMPGFGQNSEQQLPSVEGTWRTALTIRSCQTGAPLRTFQGLQTFNKGGTLTETATVPAPSLRTPGHGVWSREQGWQDYSFAFMYDLFNADGTLAGSRTVRGAVTLGASGNEFTVISSSETFDANGQLTATGCSTATATRFE